MCNNKAQKINVKTAQKQKKMENNFPFEYLVFVLLLLAI